jgi:hypothetical protein
LAYEPRQDWNRAQLDPPAREAFVRKAKADRFAWTAAELLAKGMSADAGPIALQGIALIGEEDFSSSCQRYAISVFKVPAITATAFLQSVLPRNQELAN